LANAERVTGRRDFEGADQINKAKTLRAAKIVLRNPRNPRLIIPHSFKLEFVHRFNACRIGINGRFISTATRSFLS